MAEYFPENQVGVEMDRSARLNYTTMAHTYVAQGQTLDNGPTYLDQRHGLGLSEEEFLFHHIISVVKKVSHYILLISVQK